MDVSQNANVFLRILDDVKADVTEKKDISQSISTHAGRLLDAVVDSPIDAGIKRFKALTVCNAGNTEGDEGTDKLLIVRGLSANGQDVVSYHQSSSVLATLVAYAFAIEEGGIEWKADKPKEQRRPRGDAISRLAELK